MITLLAVVLAAGSAIVAVQASVASPALALDDGLALTPPMGWNDCLWAEMAAPLIAGTDLRSASAAARCSPATRT